MQNTLFQQYQRTDVFKLWCWRRLLRVPWTARRSNQSILKKINPEYSLKKILMLGKTEGKRRRGWQRIKWLDSITDSMDMNLSKFWEIMKNREAWCASVHGVKKSQTQLSDWITTTREKNLKKDTNTHTHIIYINELLCYIPETNIRL